jgi:dipeptidyl aminopeptidase/acylaminoacyl peptidase
MKQIIGMVVGMLLVLAAQAQSKKILDHDAYDVWRAVNKTAITADGKYVYYELESQGYADPIIKLSDVSGKDVLHYDRGSKGALSYDGQQLVFRISPSDTTLRRLKRIKTEKDDLPSDSLAIYQISTAEMIKLPYLQSFKMPKKAADWLAYQTILQPDTANKKLKKSNKKNGYPLTVRQLSTGNTYDLPYVTDYQFSEKSGQLVAVSTGSDSTLLEGVYVFDIATPGFAGIIDGKGEYTSLSWDETGSQLAFVADTDTTKALVRNPSIYHWKAGKLTLLMDSQTASMTDGWQVNPHQQPMFSKNGSSLYFGVNPPPIQQDTSLLEDEIVNVEVWSYKDPRLHTQQKIDAKNDLKKGYTIVYQITDGSFTSIENTEMPESQQGDEGNANWSIGLDNQAYLQSRSWEGFPDYNDFYAIDHASGKTTLIASKVRARASMSPAAKFAMWFSRTDTAWFSYEKATGTVRQITTNELTSFADEENDSPDFPGAYGVMSWIENDSKVLIYDRFDVWEVDPKNVSKPINLTNGRTSITSYRYLKLDDEERFIKKGQKLLFRAFRESDKGEAMVSMTMGKVGIKTLLSESVHYTGVKKARLSTEIIYQKQNFEIFPDILLTNDAFKKQTKISNANPQQASYNWGTAEIVKFTSLDGKPLEGLLIKPEDFDPNKQYPMLVNFYETSTDGLNRHRMPSPGRSTLNYSFYASRGYLIFNPDIEYREGYPGESAYNCVMPGITSLIDRGIVDKDRIGVQGHSWGGYQIAYLVTQTDIFKCAEAGAPVPNMISAYGGIRWWTGLSRMFQYEHTQSRIGGTLWEYPLRFIENSPIFFVDKINTPLLMMHNDADGHVPWYQGIELFVAMRRLNKPSWMLNYQGEPHWPLKLQNRLDFNVRLQQYFDYYLKDAPMPEWMEDGVPAMQVGIDQNLELMSDQDR